MQTDVCAPPTPTFFLSFSLFFLIDLLRLGVWLHISSLGVIAASPLVLCFVQRLLAERGEYAVTLKRNPEIAAYKFGFFSYYYLWANSWMHKYNIFAGRRWGLYQRGTNIHFMYSAATIISYFMYN